MIRKADILGSRLKEYVVAKSIKDSKSYQAKGYKKKNLSPSSDFMCLFKTFYNFKYSGGQFLDVDPRDFKYESLRAMENGNSFHDTMQAKFQEMGILRAAEMTLEDPDHHIRARLDAIVEIQGVLYMVELKSAQDYSVKLMNEASQPDTEHHKQLQLYFHLYNRNKDNPEVKQFLNGRSIEHGIIFYENKNKHTPLEFYAPIDRETIDALLEWTKVVWKLVQKGKEPPSEFKMEPKSSECMYKCKARYYEMCHGVPLPPKEEPINEEVWGSAEVAKITKNCPEKFV